MQIRKLIVHTFLAFATLSGESQSENRFWLYLSDKGTAQLLDHPEQLLGESCLKKREVRGIKVDWFDLPVNSEYLNALQADENLHVRQVSKWLNAISVSTFDDKALIQQRHPFIIRVVPIREMQMASAGVSEQTREEKRGNRIKQIGSGNAWDYGKSAKQIEMLNAQWMHQRGFQGQGVVIAIMDAGFPGVDTIPAFQHIWKNGRMLAWKDFVDGDESVFEDNTHGLEVLSCVGSKSPGNAIGTSPGATFILGRTEDAVSESRQEEDNWVAAMEWADSLGADIIHSSLGYSTFDNPDEDYAYDSMDGKTAVITRAAQIAVSRGILVTTSAGNEGFSSWHYITAPCDCEGVLCVGSVDSTGRFSIFSSVGPTFDGRTKPDVVAMGSSTVVLGPGGRVIRSNGTSFAAPLVAGLSACLLQAHPSLKGSDIIDAIRKSGDKSHEPGNKFGYGVPDARIADSLLTEMEKANLAERPEIHASQHFRVEHDALQKKLLIIPLSDHYALVKLKVISEDNHEVTFLNPDPKSMLEISTESLGDPGKGKMEAVTDKGVTFQVNLNID